jgi:hypothetical protein
MFLFKNKSKYIADPKADESKSISHISLDYQVVNVA